MTDGDLNKRFEIVTDKAVKMMFLYNLRIVQLKKQVTSRDKRIEELQKRIECLN